MFQLVYGAGDLWVEEASLGGDCRLRTGKWVAGAAQQPEAVAGTTRYEKLLEARQAPA